MKGKCRRLLPDDGVDAWEGPERRNVHDGGLWAAENNRGLRIQPPDLPGQPKRQRIRAANRAQSEHVGRTFSQVRGREGEKEIARLPHLPLSDEGEEEIVKVDDQRDESMLAQARRQCQDASWAPVLT